jgi:uncharacterized membrane protein YgcG
MLHIWSFCTKSESFHCFEDCYIVCLQNLLDIDWCIEDTSSGNSTSGGDGRDKDLSGGDTGNSTSASGGGGRGKGEAVV